VSGSRHKMNVFALLYSHIKFNQAEIINKDILI
jgi:hypothetical protein